SAPRARPDHDLCQPLFRGARHPRFPGRAAPRRPPGAGRHPFRTKDPSRERLGCGLCLRRSGDRNVRRLGLVLVLVSGCAKAAAPDASVAIQSIGGPGSESGRFATPRASAWDPRGFLYVVDKTARIQKFDASGKFLLSWNTPESEKG